MAGSRFDIGGLLARFPDLSFDLEEYLLSTKYARFLDERFARFDACMTEEGVLWPCLGEMNAALRAGACAWVPAYQCHGQMGEVGALPLIDKSAIRAKPEQFLAENVSSGLLWRRQTTGSSGPPITIWYSAEAYFDFLLLSVRKVAQRAKAGGASKRPVFCLAISDNQSARDFVLADPTGAVGVSLQVVVDVRRPETFERILSLIRELSPAVISTKPSLLEMLCTMIEDRRFEWGSPPDLVVSSGALLSADLKDALRASFRSTPVDAYGMTEFGVIASECSRGRLHVDTSAVYVEVVDEDGAPVESGGDGELVVSSLGNLAMPLLRYRTGDLGALAADRCECGSSAPRLVRLSGRKIRCFRLPSGELFSPTYYNDMFARFPSLKEFQLSQVSLREYHVLVELRAGAREAAEMDAIRSHVASTLPGGADVRVVSTRFSKDSKFERFRTYF